MRRALLIAFGVMLGVVGRGHGVCAAQELAAADTLRDAKNLFIYQDFARAAELLDGLLHPEVRLDDAEDVRSAREMFAASLWYLGRTDAARAEFTLLLISSPRHRLDPFQHVPEMIAFYEELREQLIAQGAIDPDKQPGDDAPDPPPGPRTIQIEQRTVHHQPFITTLVPFGVGQFENGDTTLGTVFLVSELLALSATVATYFLILDTRVDDPERARQFETAFWASQGTFWALLAGGITEAMISYEGERVEIRTIEVPVPELQPESTDFGPALRLLPEGGATVGIGGSF